MIKVLTLDRYLLKQFFPIFLIAISMFVFILLLIDLFANLIRYLQNETPVSVIMQATLYFVPKSVSYALPISLLFAAAYTLGDLYAKNELTCIFSAGLPFWRFCAPLVLTGLLVSVFSFFLDDIIVLPAMKTKNEISRRALQLHVIESDSDIVIIARNGRLIYSVDYFDSRRNIINGVIIVETDENRDFLSQIRAHSAQWNEDHWALRNAVIYQYEEGRLRMRELPYTEEYNEHPDIFRRSSVVYQELAVNEVRLLVEDLKSVGLPYFKAQADYYHRFSFASTSFIVMILSVSMGGRFKKNILLMSLFTSLAAAVLFYITEMLSMTMAGLNYIPPIIGAWFPILLFIVIGVLLLRSART